MLREKENCFSALSLNETPEDFQCSSTAVFFQHDPDLDSTPFTYRSYAQPTQAPCISPINHVIAQKWPISPSVQKYPMNRKSPNKPLKSLEKLSVCKESIKLFSENEAVSPTNRILSAAHTSFSEPSFVASPNSLASHDTMEVGDDVFGLGSFTDTITTESDLERAREKLDQEALDREHALLDDAIRSLLCFATESTSGAEILKECSCWICLDFVRYAHECTCYIILCNNIMENIVYETRFLMEHLDCTW
jgi:hypothetical protein